MQSKKLYIVMVGLPARGKSTIASRLRDSLIRDSILSKVFNNGQLRRRLTGIETSQAAFYAPENREGVAIREKIALMNMEKARDFLAGRGQVAILDATNVSIKRREKISSFLSDHQLLFIECINEDKEILEANIARKICLPEFSHLNRDEAVRSFNQRIDFYKAIYRPVENEKNFIKLDSLNRRILGESLGDDIPFYDRLRDFLVTDVVKNLFLVRHGETFFNLENRIGGDSPLTQRGIEQARSLARHFRKKSIPVIFTSKKLRTIETAEPIKELQKNCTIISLEEFNEINSGICECMSYEEIRNYMPEVHSQRQKDKYYYVYPGGEGYATMKERIDRGIKKALYLSGVSQNIMIIGHRAVNRMILAHFLYRRTEDVPYTYIPQDKFYHIVATQNKKLFELRRF
ncbi:MAG: 6-phosphofructokinase [Desulfobacteraceae bacterium]|jgi:broad specificity phosphatase PhoE/predicted kinase|nr:MAG: 6-phosphofructokinase [Desulfobacteraceae bacterium]